MGGIARILCEKTLARWQGLATSHAVNSHLPAFNHIRRGGSSAFHSQRKLICSTFHSRYRNVLMANFLVRVEIFNANSENYEALHKGMAGIGFSKTVTFTDGSLRDLPIGTYFGSSNSIPDIIRDQVKVVANPQSSKAAAVFVAQVSDWSAFLYSA